MNANVGNCARCGDDHERLEFEELEQPIGDGDGTSWDYWAPCPNNGQPVLLRVDSAAAMA